MMIIYANITVTERAIEIIVDATSAPCDRLLSKADTIGLAQRKLKFTPIRSYIINVPVGVHLQHNLDQFGTSMRRRYIWWRFCNVVEDLLLMSGTLKMKMTDHRKMQDMKLQDMKMQDIMKLTDSVSRHEMSDLCTAAHLTVDTIRTVSIYRAIIICPCISSIGHDFNADFF